MRKVFFIVIALIIFPVWCNAADFLRALPSQSQVIKGYESVDSVQARIAELPLCPIEGIWKMVEADGAVFAIERVGQTLELAPAKLQMIMLRSPWRSIRPGTIIGHIVPTTKRGVYQARLYSDFAQKTGLSVPRGFTLELSDNDAMLSFKPFKAPVKINLLKLLPYLFRRTISFQNPAPTINNGAVRLFPMQSSHPLTPVYL